MSRKRIPPRPPRRHGQLDGLTMPSLAAIGVTTGVSVWAWFGLVLTEPQDLNWFAAIVTIAHAANGLTQLLIALHPRTPHLSWQGYRVASFVPAFGAMALTLVGWLVTAPPSLPVDDFGNNVYALIGIVAIVLVGATIAGAGLGGMFIVLPIWLITRAIRGDRAKPATNDMTKDLATLNRTQLWTGGALILAIVGFGFAMHFVYPNAPGRRAARMRAQFEALVTLTGEPVAIAVAFALIATMVALVWLHNRKPRAA
jgi:hypothetical protein